MIAIESLLNQGVIPELALGADNDMTQDHYDALGGVAEDGWKKGS